MLNRARDGFGAQEELDVVLAGRFITLSQALEKANADMPMLCSFKDDALMANWSIIYRLFPDTVIETPVMSNALDVQDLK